MRNILGLKVETKVGLFIVLMFVVFFLVTVFKNINSFNKFSDQINSYEEPLIDKGNEK
jgi:hypothetical protein